MMTRTMRKTKAFFNSMKEKEQQKRQSLGSALLADNHGLSHTAEVAIWVVAAIVIGAICFVACKKIFPEMFESVGQKITEMLNQWNITTT